MLVNYVIYYHLNRWFLRVINMHIQQCIKAYKSTYRLKGSKQGFWGYKNNYLITKISLGQRPENHCFTQRQINANNIMIYMCYDNVGINT